MGESRAGAATCFASFELVISSFDGRFWGPEKEVDVGDLGAPKAVMKDMTMQGVQYGVWCHVSTWLTSGATHLVNPRSFELPRTRLAMTWSMRNHERQALDKAWGRFCLFRPTPKLMGRLSHNLVLGRWEDGQTNGNNNVQENDSIDNGQRYQRIDWGWIVIENCCGKLEPGNYF